MSSIASDRGEARLVKIRRTTLLLLVVLILSQRLGFSVGGLTISASFLAAGALVFHALRWRYARVGSGSLIVWFCVVLLAAASTAGAHMAGLEYSAASAGAFVVAALVLVLRPRSDGDVQHACRGALFAGFQWLGVVVTLFVALQWAYQVVFSGYLDPLALLPDQVLVGGYNTRAAVAYDVSLARPNGILFLEPSLASQFLGLAAAAAYLNRDLSSHARRRFLVVALTGLVLTASGTGFVVFAIAWLIATRPGRVLALGAAGVAAMVLTFSLIDYRSVGGGVVAARFEEATSATGSGQSRFVAPYRTVASEGFESMDQVVVGNGPGSADVTRARLLAEGQGHQFFNTVLKLYWEYGIFASILFLGWLVWIARGVDRRYRALVWAVFVQYVILTGSLVFPFQPALLMLIVLGLGGGARSEWSPIQRYAWDVGATRQGLGNAATTPTH